MKNLQKGSVILWVVIIVIIGVGIYYYQTKNPASSANISINSETYSNSASPISFQYPSSWKVTDVSKPQSSLLRIRISKDENHFINLTTPIPEIGYEGEVTLSSTTISTQNGQTLVRMISSIEGEENNYHIARVFWDSTDYQKSFTFTMPYKTSDETSALKDFDSIISSIKFIK
ncbi:MAG: hypothetical protein WC648_00315 [Candidatus Paceibacterota bacterium]|jgi:hypothetical protein